ncbi:hypothetical protein [Planomonospora sp. ID82291]|uniref:hypothetical protein n=1 Tax=Planomonospora sp. ID82291 TaxID=2738136 RepID=UPI0018C3A7FF|nr:hypothetical protein [Planomonospora sp. ID82291]MBG0818461.1 hypothetical protein [Planomonospora sp. ID82291]
MNGPLGIADKDAPKALLGLVLHRHLTGDAEPVRVQVSSPWDVWWACYRAGLPFSGLGVEPVMPYGACRGCIADALECASAVPPRHPDELGERPCGCLRLWAVRMRSGPETTGWPRFALTVALIKPDAPAELITDRLSAGHEVLGAWARTLTAADTRRMYPEAYGEDYIAAVDAYLTSGPSRVMLLRSHDPGTTADIKTRIRDEIGNDRLRNHLHMPDNPGEALADLAHLVGWGLLQEFHEGADDAANACLAFYRAALGVRDTDADGVAASR